MQGNECQRSTRPAGKRQDITHSPSQTFRSDMSKRVEKALSSWVGLNKVLMKMTEDELMSALEIESAKEDARQQHLLVLHRRLKKVQTIREREALLGG